MVLVSDGRKNQALIFSLSFLLRADPLSLFVADPAAPPRIQGRHLSGAGLSFGFDFYSDSCAKFSIVLTIYFMQGVVYWQPPERALEKVGSMVWDPSLSRYGADEGLPELREALLKKVLSFLCSL